MYKPPAIIMERKGGVQLLFFFSFWVQHLKLGACPVSSPWSYVSSVIKLTKLRKQMVCSS